MIMMIRKDKMNIFLYILLFLGEISCLIYRDEIVVSTKEMEEINENGNAYSSLVPCDFL
jgi:hypothetical protein